MHITLLKPKMENVKFIEVIETNIQNKIFGKENNLTNEALNLLNSTLFKISTFLPFFCLRFMKGSSSCRTYQIRSGHSHMLSSKHIEAKMKDYQKYELLLQEKITKIYRSRKNMFTKISPPSMAIQEELQNNKRGRCYD